MIMEDKPIIHAVKKEPENRIPKLSKFKESLDRYKLFFPENCVDKTDIEILVFRQLITPMQAAILTTQTINRKEQK